MKNTNDFLRKVEELYLDYVNNFFTVRGFADHYNITEKQANLIISLGRTL